MKRTALILAAAVLTLTGSAFGDVKIKSRQTMSGQSTENTTYIKGKRQRTEMAGGSFISINQCDLARDLQLNPQTKTYVINQYEDAAPASAGTTPTSGTAAPVQKGGVMTVTTTIKDTGERKQMFGFTARHIIQTVETKSSPDSCNPTETKMEMDMWVIDAEFGLACTNQRTYVPYEGGKNGGCRDRIEQKTIGSAKSGYPLWQKMTTYSNGQAFEMVQEVVELSKATLEQALFEVPADYREVKNSAEMYASAAASSSTSGMSYNSSANKNPSLPSSSGMGSSISKAANQPEPQADTNASAKKAGTVRIGIAVKTAAVGEGVSAADLANAVQNTLGQYVKGTNVEIIPLESKLAAAQTAEAKNKECDFVLYATVSHKKGGGGGFGFGKMLGQTMAITGVPGLGATGSTVGNIAVNAASTAIITATSMSGNMKSKDEITLDLKLQSPADNSSPLAKQFKAKAKSDGDDIISQVVEQAAEAIVAAVAAR